MHTSKPICLCFVASCLSVIVATGSIASEPRNIALIITDNQNWFDLGCYGNEVIQTPNMDRLATEGVRFRQAFATVASCGASRAVIFSGLLTHANGQYAHPPREHNQQIREDVTTVFAKLKDAGYRTALIGKQHIKPMEKYPLDFMPRVGSKNVTALTEAADQFITDSGDSPFFLTLAMGDPHPNSRDGVAWGVSAKDAGNYEPVAYDPAAIEVPGFLPDTPEVRESLAGYYQQVSRADHGVGLLIETLKKHDQYDNTLIIFISDHGTSEPGAMGTQYDAGVRAPMIVRQPGGPRGVVHEALVAFTDITPTILDWANVQAPARELHGRSMLPILDQPNVKGWDEVTLSHVAHEIYSYYPMRTLRQRRYKLIWNVTWRAEYTVPIDTWTRRLFKGLRESNAPMIGPRTMDQFMHRPQFELYDLDQDPWEIHNLANDASHAQRKEQMIARLHERLVATKDPWLLKYDPWRE